MTLTIALTESIATEKSTISYMFTELNIPVVDDDLIAREVVEVGKPAYQKIVETFGIEILQSNKEIDRKQLGAIIFADEKKRKQLNNIVRSEERRVGKECRYQWSTDG